MPSIRMLVLAALVLSSLTAGAADVTSLATAYESATLGPAHAANNVGITISSLDLMLVEGAMAPVMMGEEQIGVFFSGRGTYVYRTKDPVERPLVQFEAKKLDRKTALGADGTLTVSGTFDRVLVRTGGITLPAGGAEVPAADLAADLARHREVFQGALWDPPSHLLLRQRLDAPASPVAVVEMGARDSQSGYVLDTIDEKEERLYALISPNRSYMIADLRGTLIPVKISEQPVGRTRGDFMHPRFLLVDLDYTLVAVDKAQAKLSVKETIVPRNAAQSVFRFNLVAGTRNGRFELQPMQVDSVKDAQGKPLPYDFDRGSLLVGLPAKAAAEQPFVLQFELSGNLLVRPTNDSFWQLGTEAWFPQPDLNGQYYTIHSVVKLKKPWVAFASGETVRKYEEGDYNVFENRFDKPLQFAVVHGGKYTVHEQTFDGLTIRVAPYAGINDDHVAQLARLANAMIKFYEPFLGPFPFKEFNIIEINDLGWGQAPPGMMFITQEAFNPLSTEASRVYSNGINQRFAHEIAHQYWGIAVKMGSEEEQWLTEAFSEFSSGLLIRETKGQAAYDALVATWRAEGKDGGTFAPIMLANRIFTPADPSVGYQDRYDLIYNKGAYALAVLRKELGDQKFLTWFRTLQGKFNWRFLTTNNAATILTRVDGGKDHQPFFDKYVWGTEMPVMPK